MAAPGWSFWVMAFLRTIILIAVLLLGWVALRTESAAHAAVPSPAAQAVP